MTRSTASSPLTYLPLAAGILATLLATYQLHAQCPTPPTTFPNGAVEGQVNDATDVSSNSSVAIDGEGTGRFIVAWQTSTMGNTTVSVLRFDADGTCIPDPVVILSEAIFSSVRPSVAMSRDSSVVAGFLLTGPLSLT